jgi:hypothetical protein
MAVGKQELRNQMLLLSGFGIVWAGLSFLYFGNNEDGKEPLRGVWDVAQVAVQSATVVVTAKLVAAELTGEVAK